MREEKEELYFDDASAADRSVFVGHGLWTQADGRRDSGRRSYRRRRGRKTGISI